MRSSLRILAVLAATLLMAPACGGGGDDDDDTTVDANNNNTPDANNANTPDANNAGTPDAASSVTAEHLGDVCTASVPCPDGYSCVTLQGLGSTTEGFCSIPCGGQSDTTTCSNGYTGPGTPGCYLSDGTNSSCGIMCTDSCPDGLGCFDTGQGASLCAGDEGT